MTLTRLICVLLVLVLLLALAACGGGKEQHSDVQWGDLTYNGAGDLSIDFQVPAEKEGPPAKVKVWIQGDSPDWPELRGPASAHINDPLGLSKSAAKTVEVDRSRVDQDDLGYFEYFETDVFDGLPEWTAEGTCPFAEFVVEVEIDGPKTFQRQYPCEPLPQSAFKSKDTKEPAESVESQQTKPQSDAPIPVENKNDYCKPLRGPDVVISETFDDDPGCGNLVGERRSGGKIHFYMRTKGNTNFDPFGDGPGRWASRTCAQLDNLTTGELGKAFCSHYPHFNELNYTTGAGYPPTMRPGDTIRFSLWVFTLRRLVNGHWFDQGHWTKENQPKAMDGREIFSDCNKVGDEACTIAQGIDVPYLYQLSFQVP